MVAPNKVEAFAAVANLLGGRQGPCPLRIEFYRDQNHRWRAREFALVEEDAAQTEWWVRPVEDDTDHTVWYYELHAKRGDQTVTQMVSGDAYRHTGGVQELLHFTLGEMSRRLDNKLKRRNP